MTNKEILTAVLVEWLKPVIPMILSDKVSKMPVLGMTENWVKNMGIAPANWTIMQDISPLIQGAAYDILSPIILNKLNSIPDNAIPQLAHGIVDSASKMGGYKLLGGYITFSAEDIKELKRYLDCNLPYTPSERYQVKKPEADGQQQ